MHYLATQFALIVAAMREVFGRWRFVVAAAIIASMVIVLAIWFPNLRLIGSIVSSPYMSFGAKAMFLFTSLDALRTNFTSLSRTLTVIVAILFGVNVALTAYAIRKGASFMAGTGTSMWGFIAGMFGVGCASCGSAILTALGAGGVLVFLPFRGAEFSFLSIILLSIGILLTSKRIAAPMICAPTQYNNSTAK